MQANSLSCDLSSASAEGASVEMDKMLLNDLSWASTASLDSQAPSLKTLAFSCAAAEDGSPPEGGHRWETPAELGCPGLPGGFYGLMWDTRALRVELAERLLLGSQTPASRADPSDVVEDADVELFAHALSALEGIRPAARSASVGRLLDHVHVLQVGSQSDALVNLGYEKRELNRDVRFLEGGDAALLALLQEEHNGSAAALGSFEAGVERALGVLRCAGGRGFHTWITDRDGTINNYCDRYLSSVQSLYNAVAVGRFARRCGNAVILTAAPLGGHPGRPGLVEMCTVPKGLVHMAGSKGREYYDSASREVVAVEPLPAEQSELLEEVGRRLEALCALPGNSVFLGIGSGMQRKFGEITMARNDPGGSVPPTRSERFRSELVRELAAADPAGRRLDVHDTGTDVEIFLRSPDGRPAFDKGDGVAALDRELGLGVADGPCLICGDTPSDVPMIEAALRLQVGARARRHESSEEVQARRAPSLCVLFVVTPEQHAKTPFLASTVCALCEEGGAACAILPSPDVLVAALMERARELESPEPA